MLVYFFKNSIGSVPFQSFPRSLKLDTVSSIVYCDSNSNSLYLYTRPWNSAVLMSDGLNKNTTKLSWMFWSYFGSLRSRSRTNSAILFVITFTTLIGLIYSSLFLLCAIVHDFVARVVLILFFLIMEQQQLKTSPLRDMIILLNQRSVWLSK